MSQCFRGWRAAAVIFFGLVGSVRAEPINAFSVVIPRVDIAAAGSPQAIDPNLVTWQSYDAFGGTSLNTSLWRQVTKGAGTVTTGANGVTLTPDALTAPGVNDLALQGTLAVPVGGYFALRVPFLITSAITDLTGFVDLNVNICAPLVDFLCDSPSWAQANDVIPPLPGATAPFTGTAFVGTMDATPDFLIDPTTALLGQIAIIYSGDTFRNFVDDGTGWRQLGPAYVRPAAWTPLLFEIDAEVRVNPAAAVPEPATLALILLGLVAVSGSRRSRPTLRR